MSKLSISKIPAILIGLSMLAITAYPAFAQYAANPPVRSILPTRPEAVGSGAAMREKLASKAAALKQRLQTFKDKKKAEIADRINTNLNNINQNQTAQMQKHLDRMSEILDKLEARVNRGTPDIKDTASARVAIASARAAIATASAAVSSQMQKDYTIQITSEGRIGLDAKTQRDKLHTDLLSVRKLVIDAKQAVANAIRVAKSGKVEIPGLRKEGTSSGQQ